MQAHGAAGRASSRSAGARRTAHHPTPPSLGWAHEPTSVAAWAASGAHCTTVAYGRGTAAARVVACLPPGPPEAPSTSSASSAFGAAFTTRRTRRGGSRRTSKPDSSAAASPAGPAPSAASSPVPAPASGGGGGGYGGGGGGGVVAAAATSTAAVVTVAVASADSRDGSDSDYEGLSGGAVAAGSHIVPFARSQPRALVLDCAYRPINVLTWYRAFHFDYFGKGEVLEYYPPPAICTTGSGEFPLPAVLRVPQYTANVQDLCSRVACTRRNVMVRDGFCCQYCGSRRDLTIDHVHPASKGGKETWENLVTACMRCNQKKSDRTLRDLSWKLRRQPREPTPYEIGIVAGIATVDILRPPPEWEAYIAPYRERLEMYRRAAVEAGLVNLIDDYVN